MTMRYWLLILGLLTCALPACADYTVEVTPDKPAAMYRLNEPIHFLVRVRADGQAVTQGHIAYLLDNGLPDNHDGHVGELGTTPTEIQTTRGEPGVVRCTVTFSASATLTVSATAVVGVALERLQPSLEEPADFDAFWKAQQAELEQTPTLVSAQPVTTTTPGVLCDDVVITCLPHKNIRGYLAKPKGAAPHSLPAVLWLPFAGVSGANRFQAENGAAWWALSLSINIFGIENGKSDAEYAAMQDGALKNYYLLHREDRETYFFHDAYLMALEACIFLTRQPEWNGTVLAVCGASQGGALAIAVAAMEPRVTLLGAAVPAMCDHTGPLLGRAAPWPLLVPFSAEGNPDAAVLQTASYYDGVNFAKRVKARALVSVGFLDLASPPTTVYTAYNVLKGEKQIQNGWQLGHALTFDFDKAFLTLLTGKPAS